MQLPDHVDVVEVGPRDGFQNVKEWIPTEVKLEIIDALVRSNVSRIQATSFVHPKAVPQMRDAQTIARTVLVRYPNVGFSALVPNLHGARAAWQCGIRCLSYVISASEEHNAANVNRTIGQSIEEFCKLRQEFPTSQIQLDVAVAFGCPFQGTLPESNVMSIVDRVIGLGIRHVCLCDTIGAARPPEVEAMVSDLLLRHPDVILHLHLHDTRGRALENTLSGIRGGAVGIETSIGGLGGCPFTPGATGNTATEDVVDMLEGIGIATGIDSDCLKRAAALVKRSIRTSGWAD